MAKALTLLPRECQLYRTGKARRDGCDLQHRSFCLAGGWRSCPIYGLDPTFCFSALGHGFTKPHTRAVRFEMFDWHVIRSMLN
jgi:hypothetical protein